MTPEEKEQTYQEILNRYDVEIRAVINRYTYYNGRLEFDDLYQEVALQLWLVIDYVLVADNPKTYVKQITARAAKKYVERFKRDASYKAKYLDEVYPDPDEDEEDTTGTYQRKRIVSPILREWIDTAKPWHEDPPPECPVRTCRSKEFQLITDKDGKPWWKCTKGHRVFGYWRTEKAVRRTLKHYHTLRDACVGSSWPASEGKKYISQYPPWEKHIDTKVDVDRALRMLNHRRRKTVILHLVQNRAVRDIQAAEGLSKSGISRECAKATAEMAYFLGAEWAA